VAGVRVRVRVGQEKAPDSRDQGLCPSFRGIAANLFQAATSAIPLAITLALLVEASLPQFATILVPNGAAMVEPLALDASRSHSNSL
jgi:hypothetical protein